MPLYAKLDISRVSDIIIYLHANRDTKIKIQPMISHGSKIPAIKVTARCSREI